MKKKQRRPRITVNFNNVMSENIGAKGVKVSDISALGKRIKQAAKNLKQKREDAFLGFMYLPYDVKVKEEVKKTAELIRGRFENFVVLGIGGSALGTIALKNALKHPFYNMLPQAVSYTHLTLPTKRIV